MSIGINYPTDISISALIIMSVIESGDLRFISYLPIVAGHSHVDLSNSFCICPHPVFPRFVIAPSRFSDIPKEYNQSVIKSQQGILNQYNDQVD